MSRSISKDLPKAALDDFKVPENFNMVSVLLDCHIQEGRGHGPAIHYQDRIISYNELFHNVNRFGNGLRNLGLRIEQRILIFMPDCPEFIEIFLAAMKIGAVPVPINTFCTPEDLKYFLNDSRAKMVGVSTDLLARIEAVRQDSPYLRKIIVVGDDQSEGRDLVSYDGMKRQESSDLQAEETSKDDPSYWLYTSGSTGLYKGVVHLHHDMVYCTRAFGTHVLRTTPEDRLYSVSKLFFSYGLVNSLYMPLLYGASVILLRERPEPPRILNVIERYRPTLFFSVPTSYAAILREVEDGKRAASLHSVRLCVSAGEPLPAAIYKRWWEHFGADILDAPGSTEAGYIFIASQPGRVKAGCSGEPVPGWEVKIVDESGDEVKPGQVGDLLVKSDSIAPFYWNKHAETKRTFLGEWLRTGDKFYRDEERYYYYVGRSDDMLKVGGLWVSPIEVENTILEHPSVQECAVVGAKDEDQLIKPEAFIVLKWGVKANESLAKVIREFAKHKIAPYKCPRWIRFVDDIPKTATGKLQRYKLRGQS